MVKITTESMWKSLTLDQTWQATSLILSHIALHMHACCFVVSFRLSFEHPLHSSTNRESIWSSYWLQILLCGHTLLLALFVAYFSKKNYSQRQIILKISRVWERSLISIPFGAYLALIEVGTWLGESITKKGGVNKAKEGPDTGTEHTHCSIWSVHQEEIQ